MNAPVVTASLIAGSICFALYVVETVAALWKRPDGSATLAQAKGLAPPTLTAEEIVKIMQAFTGLVDSLGKVGPALTSLIGALIFFVIAAFAGGALHG